ncbi:MAG: hypothetical protein V4576_01260 [Patescibacteria group bacterium]
MENKQIHFSISKNTLILVSVIIAFLLIVIIGLCARGNRHEMMMRQGQNGDGYMMQNRQGGTRGPGPGSARGMMQGGGMVQPTTGAVQVEASTTMSN